MRGLGGLESVRVVDASEVTRGDVVGGKGGGGGMVVLSQSGETKDCHRAVVLGGEEGVVCFSIVNAVRFGGFLILPLLLLYFITSLFHYFIISLFHFSLFSLFF